MKSIYAASVILFLLPLVSSGLSRLPPPPPILPPVLAEDEYNYLIASFNYAVAIRHNFEDAADYYGQYYTQELEVISDRLLERIAEAASAATTDTSAGQAISTCASTASFAIQRLMTPVNQQFQALGTSTNRLHQAINEKMIEYNMLELPMDEFYYKFTDRMFVLYMRLNDEILPEMMDAIVAMITAGDEIYQSLNACLDQI